MTADANERIELYTTMGQVYEQELRDLDRAIDAYNDVLSVEADHPAALAGLANLYEETEQWDRAVEMMRRLIQVSSDGRQKVDLNYRIGRIYDEQMKDAGVGRGVPGRGARPSIRRTCRRCCPCWALYKRRGDWLKAAQLMVRAEAAHRSTRWRRRACCSRRARSTRRSWATRTQAADLFARVMQLDPEHVEAAEPLSRALLRARGVGAAGAGPRDAGAQGRPQDEPRADAALLTGWPRRPTSWATPRRRSSYYKQSYDLDSTYLPTLVDRAALLYRLEQWDDAFRIYQTILVHHRDAQKDDEIVDIFFRLGRIKLKLDERKKALNMFEKALEIQPATGRPSRR